VTETTAEIAARRRAEGESTPVVVRKALLTDVSEVLALINGYASLGVMLPRMEFELSESIRDFTVAFAAGRVVGCGALHFFGTRMAEVRSLAVRPEWKNRGLGARIMEALEQEAANHGLQSLFAFTYVPGFFAKRGFVEVDRRTLPSKVWKDCLRCPKLQCCDEVAMQKILAAAPAAEPGERTPTELS